MTAVLSRAPATGAHHMRRTSHASESVRIVLIVIVPAVAERIHEVLPGVVHWTARHPSAPLESGSHYLVEEGVLIDPIAPPEGLEWFGGRQIGEILLTNRHHT